MSKHIRGYVVLASIIGAAIVASSGHDGWGWFLFLAFLIVL